MRFSLIRNEISAMNSRFPAKKIYLKLKKLVIIIFIARANRDFSICNFYTASIHFFNMFNGNNKRTMNPSKILLW